MTIPDKNLSTSLISNTKATTKKILIGQSWPLFVPCQETQMVAVQIPCMLQTQFQETYYTTLKYKNEIILVPSFVAIGLFLRPSCFRKEA